MRGKKRKLMHSHDDHMWWKWNKKKEKKKKISHSLPFKMGLAFASLVVCGGQLSSLREPKFESPISLVLENKKNKIFTFYIFLFKISRLLVWKKILLYHQIVPTQYILRCCSSLIKIRCTWISYITILTNVVRHEKKNMKNL